jgi:hypothetical protein
MAKLLLQRRKRVESSTGTSVPEIRVVGSNLKLIKKEKSTLNLALSHLSEIKPKESDWGDSFTLGFISWHLTWCVYTLLCI